MDEFERERRRADEREPVDEAGGGEAEGFEQAEEELIESATHGAHEGGGGHPLGDRMTPEADPRAADAVHGEADHHESPDSTEEADARRGDSETDDATGAEG